MSPRRVFLIWALLAVGLLLLGGAMASRWYHFHSDSVGNAFTNLPPGFGFDPDDDEGPIEPPAYLLHTDFMHDAHQQDAGGGGSALDEEDAPYIAQVTTILRTFYIIGFVGLVIATVGLLFRMRGVGEGKGLVATLAVLSIVSVGFSVLHFSINIADAYNEELEEGLGESPDIAFWSAGIGSDEGVWQNVTSGPHVGWYIAILGIASIATGFALVYADDLRRARAVLTDDEAAAAQYAQATERRAHVLDRIREEARK